MFNSQKESEFLICTFLSEYSKYEKKLSCDKYYQLPWILQILVIGVRVLRSFWSKRKLIFISKNKMSFLIQLSSQSALNTSNTIPKAKNIIFIYFLFIFRVKSSLWSYHADSQADKQFHTPVFLLPACTPQILSGVQNKS